MIIHDYYIVFTLLLHHYIIITSIIITCYYNNIIMYYYIIITLLLHHCYVIIISLLQNGNHVIMIASLHVMQMGCLHYYVIITHYYVITTQTSVITHYYPFQSPELADEEQTQLQQVPQHFDCARANGSLFAPQVDLISFTSYGADWRTQELNLNRPRDRDFLNFCWAGPHVGPTA